MVMPISQLQSMEFALYGGRSGLNMNCPSYANGYRASLVPNYGYNPNFTALADATRVANNRSLYENNPNGRIDYNNPSFASSADLETLANYYSKHSAPSESLTSAAVGGAAFSLLTNLRFLAHPWNSLTTLPSVDKMFKAVKEEGSVLNGLWKNPEKNGIIRDAYHKMHKLECAAKGRWTGGAFKARLDETLVKQLRNDMNAALTSGKAPDIMAKEIAEVSEKIKVATNYKNGYIPQAWAKVKNWFGFGDEKLASVKDKLSAESANITTAAANSLKEKASMTIGQHFKKGIKGQGILGGLLMMGMEVFSDWDKLKAAFSKDTSTGMAQAGQTAVKGAGSLLGWTAGEAVGAWAGAKLGMWAGTAICPGVGTAIGAIAGMVGGSIGCALMGKISHWIVGKDVGEKVQLAQMKSTPEGQMQLLQQTMEIAQNDKKIDPRTIQAMQNVYNTFSASA